MIFTLAAFLEREGGYSLVCLALIAVGVTLADPIHRPQIAHDLVVFATGVLARSMGSKKPQNSIEAPKETP